MWRGQLRPDRSRVPYLSSHVVELVCAPWASQVPTATGSAETSWARVNQRGSRRRREIGQFPRQQTKLGGEGRGQRQHREEPQGGRGKEGHPQAGTRVVVPSGFLLSGHEWAPTKTITTVGRVPVQTH